MVAEYTYTFHPLTSHSPFCKSYAGAVDISALCYDPREDVWDDQGHSDKVQEAGKHCLQVTVFSNVCMYLVGVGRDL